MLCWLTCALLCDSVLLIVSAKDKNSEFFSYFEKVKGEFFAKSYSIYMNKGLSNTPWHLCCCKCVHEHMRTAIACFLRSLHGCLGSAVSWNRQDCNRQSMIRVQNTSVNWDWSVFKCSDRNVVFQTAIFLILFVSNNKRSSGNDGGQLRLVCF